MASRAAVFSASADSAAVAARLSLRQAGLQASLLRLHLRQCVCRFLRLGLKRRIAHRQFVPLCGYRGQLLLPGFFPGGQGILGVLLQGLRLHQLFPRLRQAAFRRTAQCAFRIPLAPHHAGHNAMMHSAITNNTVCFRMFLPSFPQYPWFSLWIPGKVYTAEPHKPHAEKGEDRFFPRVWKKLALSFGCFVRLAHPQCLRHKRPAWECSRVARPAPLPAAAPAPQRHNSHIQRKPV